MNSSKKATLPRDLGFRMPAEWSPHTSTWIAWPHQKSDWPGKIAPIPYVYGEIVRHLHQYETVNIVVHNEKVADDAKKTLTKAGIDFKKVIFRPWATDRVWTRDSGPTFLVNSQGEQALLDWHFNAWAKYDNWTNDDQLPGRIKKALKLPCWQPHFGKQRLVLEGGSIEVNGAGLLLTTEECLLSEVQCRNPGLSAQDYEQVFEDYLGIEKVLWLNRGIVGDDTHGHIDDLARFVGENTIVTVIEKKSADENYWPLQENWDRLKGMTNLKDRSFEVVALPMPNPVYFDGQRLPASYANFYIANEIVLVPTFNDENDYKALGILKELFPKRKVVGIHAVDLVWGLGTLHCMTQQAPAPIAA